MEHSAKRSVEEQRAEGGHATGQARSAGSACDADVCDRSKLVRGGGGGGSRIDPGLARLDRGAPDLPVAEDSCTDTDDQNSNYLSINNSRSSSCFDLPGECAPMIVAGDRTLPMDQLRLCRQQEQPTTAGMQNAAGRQAAMIGPDADDDDDNEEDEDDEDSSMLTHSAATTATISSNKSRLNGFDLGNGCSGGSELAVAATPDGMACVHIVDNPVSEATTVDLGDGTISGNRPTAAMVNGGGHQQQQQQQQQLQHHQRVTTTPSNLSNCSGLPAVTVVQLKQSKNLIYFLRLIFNHCKSSGIGEPSVYHALVVIFLEFFAWGLLTMPVINVLNQTFPDHTFLMNGLVMGIKGILSFLSAPLIGALSDVWGRKFFLLITVFFTCAPIPLMSINSWWFFAMISISGVFAVTFSVVFAYVADVTTVEDRSRAYGLVSATFAASLVISPALGAYLNDKYSEPLIVALATAIAVLDVFFILVAVPESLPEKVRPSSWGAPISWEQADPFAALRKVGLDQTILMQCVTVLLSYLPEAGQYSCIFVYLKLKMHFSSIDVSIFIAVVGILSILAQVILGDLMKALGAKRTIIIGLLFEMLQLLWYGFGSQTWMMWAAGILASLASITYPAISAFVSIHSNPDQQGVVQGMVTGMRGLCNGLGPAMFGVIFYVFHVDLNDEHNVAAGAINGLGAAAGAAGGGLFENPDAKFVRNETLLHGGAIGGVHHRIEDEYSQLMPGPPFVFGALMVICAIAVAAFIPEAPSDNIRRPSGLSLDVDYEYERGRKVAGPLSPLMHQDSAQL
ncbi:hippocampus abundant transcript 1 protein-like isoform X2 [Anopheles albimanus]|uniref:Major facilitator superfamily (MFS) profile domain-containing protein n=1 Tax=Anopheles albimanus TaxID=7167 RepID=A0A8W7JNT5_ANOAL|nr:hippocampus abundant transcript 1 protein-like isoform X2 [Anopheles albimanus]